MIKAQIVSYKEIKMQNIEDFLCCPRCRAPIDGLSSKQPVCSNPSCDYSTKGFLVVSGQPVLIDFDKSIFYPEAFLDQRGSIMPRDDSGDSLRTRFRRFIFGENPVEQAKCREFCDRVKHLSTEPRVLIIGGGAIGSGTRQLYQDPGITVIGTDVYVSPYTRLVADGHYLPFRDAVFDGVWIQGVLEHVLEPQRVVEEVYRVLKPGSLVYDSVPFIQQVHEKAYDFTRFTMNGHRWLFRGFEQIDAGSVGGAGTAAIWSLRYLWRALGIGDKGSTLLTLPFFWLHCLDRITQRRPNADAASGTYFFGIRSNESLNCKDMVAYYESQ